MPVADRPASRPADRRRHAEVAEQAATWLMAGAEAFGDGQMPFHIPWGALALIVGLPLIAALAATAWPAARAAAIRPAVALRTAV